MVFKLGPQDNREPIMGINLNMIIDFMQQYSL